MTHYHHRACRKDPLSQCMYGQVAEAKLARWTLGALPNQYPCVVDRSTAEMALAPEAQTALETGVMAALPAAAALGDVFDVLAQNHVTVDSHEASKSSHGKVSYVTVHPQPGADEVLSTCEAGHVLNRHKIQAVVKIMPIDNYAAPLPNDSAFLDPVIAWMGSQLVANGRSLGFAQVYGSFLGTANLKGSRTVPVVALIMERLTSSVYDVIMSYMKGDVQWRELIALVLQVMLVLHEANTTLKLVHNDTHLGNFMTGAMTCEMPTAVYVRTPAFVLRLPITERVVLLDFGRSTADMAGTELVTSEVQFKFPKWNRGHIGTDVTHFLAMLVVAQPEVGWLEKQAALPGAPPEARAFVKAVHAALQCPHADMYKECHVCKTSKAQECVSNLVHKLRKTENQCMGTRPGDWLQNLDLVRPFLQTKPIPPSSSILDM